MATNGFQNSRYLARSWAMMTRDKGWIKPILVLSVALLVPIAGPLAVLGYCVEWARLTAWGSDTAPKQTAVRVGELISCGWRAFVVMFVGLIAWLIIQCILLWVFSFSSFTFQLVQSLGTILNLFVVVLVTVMAIHASIYQKVIAGLRPKRIWQMVSHDPVGLLRVVGINLLFSAIGFVIQFVVTIVGIIASLPALIPIFDYLNYSYGYSYGSSYAMLQSIMGLLSAVGPIIVIGLVLSLILTVVMMLISYNAVGLWMRQFDVASWGPSSSPVVIPGTATDADAPVAPAPAAASAAPAEAPVPEQVVTPAPAAAAAPAVAPEPVATPAPAAPAVSEPAPAQPAAQPEVVNPVLDDDDLAGDADGPTEIIDSTPIIPVEEDSAE